jgi:hypothetical protein
MDSKGDDMENHSARSEPEATGKKKDRTGRRLRDRAEALLSREEDGEGGDRGRAALPADVLGAVADSVEAVAEGCRTSGMAVRDRGRDAARAMRRGERVLRESGYLGGTLRVAGMTRRHLRGLALTGAGVVAAVVLYRKLNRDA